MFPMGCNQDFWLVIREQFAIESEFKIAPTGEAAIDP